jgi:hypothetical protein
MSNIAKPMKAEFFPDVLDPREDGHSLERA